MTRVPARRAICTSSVPTPPPAASTRTVSPARRSARPARASAVRPSASSATASRVASPSGMPISRSTAEAARSAYPPVPVRLATTRRPAHGLASPTVPPTPLPRMAGSAGSIDGCGGRPARTWVSTKVTLANSTSMTTSSGPARTSATSAGSSTSGGPNSRITTARTPGLLHPNDPVRNEPIVSLPLRAFAIAGLTGGAALLAAFGVLETRIEAPMFQLSLFRIRAFTAGNLAGLAVAIARGGLQFMLIIWLQGIWLPLHGYDYSRTPLWAGIFLLPLTVGFLIAGPVSGYLSDRFGARLFATGGLVLVAVAFLGMLTLPVDFRYPEFAGLLLLSGIGQGMFSAPNTAAIMSSVPAGDRGVASGMRSTFQNSGMSLSIGVFFSLMVAGLAGTLPHT